MCLSVSWMRGERPIMWLNKLKIAVIEKNFSSIDKLLGEIPKLQSQREIEEAIYLLKEASDIADILKDDTSKSMKQIKKNLNFLRSTDIPTSKNLDIRS